MSNRDKGITAMRAVFGEEEVKVVRSGEMND